MQKPDGLIFDFDPDEDLDFADVKKAAREIRALLAAIGLVAFAIADVDRLLKRAAAKRLRGWGMADQALPDL